MFLNGKIEVLVFVTQPLRFEIKDNEYMVYRLDKILCGLKQAPRAWIRELVAFSEIEIQQIHERVWCVYAGKTLSIILICLYVDDLVVTGSNKFEIKRFKELMMSNFDMTNLGMLSYFLRI